MEGLQDRILHETVEGSRVLDYSNFNKEASYFSLSFLMFEDWLWGY